MKSLVALTLVLAVAAGDMALKKKIHHDMMLMNSQAMCWGQGNMMYYKMAMMQALEECHDGHSSTKPATPFAQLNRPQSPFQTLPSAIQAKNPFSGNSVSFWDIFQLEIFKAKPFCFSSTRNQPSTLSPSRAFSSATSTPGKRGRLMASLRSLRRTLMSSSPTSPISKMTWPPR